MDAHTRAVLAVMARYPIPGASKTRLAAALGAPAADQLYRAFLSDLEDRLRAVAVPIRWFYAPADRDFAALLRSPAHCEPQCPGDLGTRMLDVFTRLCTAGFDRVVMIGSDAPHLDLAAIEQAIERTTPQRVVFGPALDGGYYLIAMGQPHDVFSGIAWSTATVLQRSRERAASLGLDVELLAPTFDIDDASDVTRLRELLAQRAPSFLTATRRVLASLPAA